MRGLLLVAAALAAASAWGQGGASPAAPDAPTPPPATAPSSPPSAAPSSAVPSSAAAGRAAPASAAPEPVAPRAPALQVAIEAQALATDNATPDQPNPRADLLLTLRPSVGYRRISRGLDIDLEAAVKLIATARDSQDANAWPDVRARARATVLDQWFWLEGAAQWQAVQVDPFTPSPADNPGVNARRQHALRLSPVLEREFSARDSVLLRHDMTEASHPTLEDSRFHSRQTLARLSRKPQRLGGALEWSRQESDTDDEEASRLLLERWQVHGMVEAIDDWVLGAYVGRERSRFFFDDRTDGVQGLSLRWAPSPRTELDLRAEQRFFGKAGVLDLRHRMPMMSIVLRIAREPQTSLASLGSLGPGGDVRTLLDGILSTRVPEADERRALVDSLIADRGLTTRLARPVEWFAAYPQLASTASVSALLHGVRNTTSLSAFRRTVVALNRDDAVVPIPAVDDSRQTGVGLRWSRRLSTRLDAETGLQWTRVEGLGLRQGETSDVKVVRMAVTQRLTPHTQASGGVQYLRTNASGAGRLPYDATTIFFGLKHRL
jgi:uncharacterized protein (PEP-CTERM system associated)